MGEGDTSDLPQPPFVNGNLEYLNVICEFEERTLLSVLVGTGLNPAPTRHGGFLVIISPQQARLGAFTVAQAWVDVAGYDSTDGSHARLMVQGWYSGINGEVARRIYNAPAVEGEATLTTSGGEVVARAFSRSGEVFRIRSRLLGSEPEWRTSMHFYVRPLPAGRMQIHHVGHSSLSHPAEPVALDNFLGPDTPDGCDRLGWFDPSAS